MFVTSDIFDLRQIGWRLDFDWRENLICGVDLHGPVWPGVEATAGFMIAAARRSGLLEAMQYAGYHRGEQARSRMIGPKSVEKLSRGELRGAQGADGMHLLGFRETRGADRGRIAFGGEASSRTRGGRQRLRANFIFPFEGDPFGLASELLRLAATGLGVEYGYVFIRDDFCSPGNYPMDSSVPPYFAPWGEVCRSEIDHWWRYAKEQLWLEERLLLRDLYQQNLLSARHLSQPLEGLGRLADWIVAEPDRGRLEDLGDGRMLWSLTDAEMVQVRPVLNRAGLLHSCGERVYRDLPGGVAPTDRPIPPRIDFRYEDGSKPIYH